MSPTETFLTIPEVAVLLRVHERTIYNRVADGSIKSVRVGKAIRIPRDQFLTHMVTKMPEGITTL